MNRQLQTYIGNNHLLFVDNIDSGKRWLLNDCAGKPVKKWDSRGNEFTFYYDELQRPIKTKVNGICIEKLVYGSDAQGNSIGQIIESYAQDGKTSFEYDFKGNIVSLHKQFTEGCNARFQAAQEAANLPQIREALYAVDITTEDLNRFHRLLRAFIFAAPSAVFMQGMIDQALQSLVWRDDQSGKYVFNRLLDGEL